MPSPFYREITRSFTEFPYEWRAFTLLLALKTIEALQPIKDLIHTITADNGKEFANIRK